MSQKRKKRKWWFSKPFGNCPASREWLRNKRGKAEEYFNLTDDERDYIEREMMLGSEHDACGDR